MKLFMAEAVVRNFDPPFLKKAVRPKPFLLGGAMQNLKAVASKSHGKPIFVKLLNSCEVQACDYNV